MKTTAKVKHWIFGITSGILLLAIISVGAYLLQPGSTRWNKTVHQGHAVMHIIPLSEMSMESDKIVLGTVVERGESFFEDSGSAFTPVIIQVNDLIKGPERLTTTMYLEWYGDFKTETYHYLEDGYEPYPVQVGTQVVLFLNATDGAPAGGNICEVKDGIVHINPYIEDAREISDTLEIPYKDFKTLIQEYLG